MLRGQDLNLRPSGYEPDELPDCSTPPRHSTKQCPIIAKMERREMKMLAAKAALDFVGEGARLGVGSGSTAHCFIELLPQMRARVEAVVASSEETARRLEAAGFRCTAEAGGLDLYVDGADEADGNRQLIKGGGGAHAREKVVACSAQKFVCIVDESKRVARLGEKHPVPVEVLPMARGHAARKLAAMGATPDWREGFVTDNGNWILDARLLDLTDAAATEREINLIAGVLENGIFARRRADVLLTATANGVTEES